MLDARELGSLVAAAEHAAAAGDYDSAAERLREAATLQETHLGLLHPDLANTLNNLGVVYEKAEKPGSAEDCYRRAYVIATTVLAPDHPFVATSGKNLRDFCRARGIPFESEWPSSSAESRPAASKAFSRPVVIGAASVVALALGLFFASRQGASRHEPVRTSTGSVKQRIAASPTPTPKPAPAKPSPVTTEVTTISHPPIATPPKAPIAELPKTTTPAPPKTTPAAASLPARSSSVTPMVADARLCKTLSTRTDWHCDAANSPLGPGAFYFYTRLLSPGDTTVEHRWYRGDRVHQVVKLRIRANQGGGYRTYSRNSVSADRAGDWKVELRAKDGLLLHEERFSVH